MRGLHALRSLGLLFLWTAALAAAQTSHTTSTKRWMTLSGRSPLVVAHGGCSGVFPDSSIAAYSTARDTSLPDVIFWCDVQVTRDQFAICFPGLNLGNGSTIELIYKGRNNTYPVNGALMKGYFPVDFTLRELAPVFLTQAIYSRSDKFDNSMFPIMTVEEVAALKPPRPFWLNIQNNGFYESHLNMSMRSYVLSLSRKIIVNYISSPDVSFLRSISKRFNGSVTKLMLRVLKEDEIEHSTNQTYGYLLKNLALVKNFAQGILIDKSFIWRVNKNGYLVDHTSVVIDAHSIGLEVFASGIANDFFIPYNYSYDPVAEIVQFIDNGKFAVDGLLSDFPLTSSAAVDCFTQIGNDSGQENPLIVITNNGASGDYPGCTDDAYRKAIMDGADYIDCQVQMTKDGIAFCANSINLLDFTNAAQSSFVDLTTSIPEIQMSNGIGTFSLSWSDIQQSLKPQIMNPFAKVYFMYRNPANKNSGKLIKLSDFLDLAKTSSVSGVLVSIENAAYLAEKQNLDVVGAVFDALGAGNYTNQAAKKVMIQSTNSSVLNKFKNKGNFELVYKISETIGGVSDSALEDIKKLADSVVINKASIFQTSASFIIGSTDVVQKLQSHNLSVYVELFRNEFVAQSWDFLSDPMVEYNTFFVAAGINGVITEFPKTAVLYKKNTCSARKNIPSYMNPVQPGGLLEVMSPQSLPPAEAPSPELADTEVTESPLPPVVAPAPTPNSSTNSSMPRPPASKSGHPKNAVSLLMLPLVMLLVLGFLF